jgi:hypothetical protein
MHHISWVDYTRIASNGQLVMNDELGSTWKI